MEPKTKKIVTYESNLILNKLRNLTEQEIATVLHKNKVQGGKKVEEEE